MIKNAIFHITQIMQFANCCDMDDEDISQNQMKFGCSIEILIEK